MPTMTRPPGLSRELADALLYVLDYELREGVPPTRAASDAHGHTAAVSCLVELGYVRHPRLGLSRLTLTPAGRALAEELS